MWSCHPLSTLQGLWDQTLCKEEDKAEKAEIQNRVKSPMNLKTTWRGQGIQQEYILEPHQNTINNWSVYKILQIPKCFHAPYFI